MNDNQVVGFALKPYIGTKAIDAEPMTRGQYNAFRGWQMPEGEVAADEGYVVWYPDGYISWSPKKQFEEAYQPPGAMSFGHALYAMKQGKKVARAGWNGKGMWLCLGQGNLANPAANFWNRHTREFAESNGGSAPVLPYIIMKTATGEILMGWLASQTDMLAEDWSIIE